MRSFALGVNESQLMITPTASSTQVWCVYSRGSKLGGPLFVKHPAGITLLGFGSQDLAEHFLLVWRLPSPHEAVLVSELGSAQFPNHSTWMPQTDQIMLIRTPEQLRAYATDPGAFALSSNPITVPINYGTAVNSNDRNA